MGQGSVADQGTLQGQNRLLIMMLQKQQDPEGRGQCRGRASRQWHLPIQAEARTEARACPMKKALLGGGQLKGPLELLVACRARVRVEALGDSKTWTLSL